MPEPLNEPMNEPLGTHDLEKGMRPSRASDFRTIALNAVMLLLLFNSDGLVQWAQRLPSNKVNAWLAELAADWNGMMHLSPAEIFGRTKKSLSIDPK
jgi:hypothetical protein